MERALQFARYDYTISYRRAMLDKIRHGGPGRSRKRMAQTVFVLYVSRNKMEMRKAWRFVGLWMTVGIVGY